LYFPRQDKIFKIVCDDPQMIPGFGSFLFSPPVGSNWVEIGLEPTATQTLSVICSVLHDLCRLKATLHTGPKYPSFFWSASSTRRLIHRPSEGARAVKVHP